MVESQVRSVEYLCGDALSLRLSSVLSDHQLFCHQWKPPSSPRALLCLCHGVTEHMQRYQKLGDYLAENLILMFGHDHGHGQSEGERVFVDAIDTYVQDVIQHMEEVKRQYPDLPCFLMGHSMGGLIAAHVAVQRQNMIQGLILSSAPTAQIYNSTPKKLVKPIVRMMTALMPHTPLIPWSARAVSSVPAEVKEFSEDPLIYHGRIRFSWVNAMIESLDKLEESLSKIALPLLLLHGSEDAMVPISSSEHLYQAVSSTDKIFEVFAGNYHEVLHDIGHTKAISAVAQWILNHV